MARVDQLVYGHSQSPCAELRLDPQCDRSQRVPVYFSVGSSVLRWAVEVPKGILGLWFLCGIDLYLHPALPRGWKRAASVLLAFYVRSLPCFYRAGCAWQKAVVQSILSRAVGVDTLVYAAAIFDRALDSLVYRQNAFSSSTAVVMGSGNRIRFGIDFIS